MIKTAIIGASGYIGHHLLNAYREEFPDTLGTTFSQNVSDLNQFDIRKGDIENLALHKTGHKAAIIASAKPNISFCEREPSKAYDVNDEKSFNLHLRKKYDLFFDLNHLITTNHIFINFCLHKACAIIRRAPSIIYISYGLMEPPIIFNTSPLIYNGFPRSTP